MDIEYQGLGIVELAKHSLKKPEDFGWWGREEMFVTWGWTGIDKNNSSDAVEIVNFDTITEDLIAKFPDDFDIVGLRHWAVGHVDRLTCRVLKDENVDVTEENITDAFKAAMTWQMQLEDYPVANDDRLAIYCENEMFDWIKSELPMEVYIAKSKDETVAQIIEEMVANDDFDPMDWILSDRWPSEEMIRYIAYDLSLCAAEHYEFWNEWVDEQGLPPIIWGDNFGAPPNKAYYIDSQLSLFEKDENG
jgi:hypothetical protein